MSMNDIDTLHLRSHAEGVCRDLQLVNEKWPGIVDYGSEWLMEYSLDILCLMALTEALGLEYGDYTSTENAASPGT